MNIFDIKTLCQFGLRVVLISCPLVLTGQSKLQQYWTVSSNSGLKLTIAEENNFPTLRILLPGQPATDRSIEIIFPEHLTIRPQGKTNAHQLYLFQPGRQADRPQWKRSGQSLEYTRDFQGEARLLARATLEEDGVLFHFEITNESKVKYDLIYAPIDPRLTSAFHDERLERTYVHHVNGFELLASETPERLTLPLSQWLPSRYLVAYTWSVPSNLAERRDGIMHYNKSRSVDAPFIATLSKDGQWVVASFTNNTGNVWSNPELTCQHVDPQVSAEPGATAIMETKIVVVHGTLESTFELAMKQRKLLRP